MTPRRLKSWEYARVSKQINEEIRSRQEYPGSVAKPIGDPSDVVAMRAAIEILYWHSENSLKRSIP